MSEKSISEYLQCQFQRAQGKCCAERGCGTPEGNGFWKQLHKRQKNKHRNFNLGFLQTLIESHLFLPFLISFLIYKLNCKNQKSLSIPSILT